VWNLRLELGHQLSPTPLRTTEFAPPVTQTTLKQAPVQGYSKPAVALPWKAGRFCGRDFALQPDGTLACPASKTLRPTEQRRACRQFVRHQRVEVSLPPSLRHVKRM